MESLVERVIGRDEGLRLEPYKDSLGYWTIGYGHLIDRRKNGRLPIWISPSFPITENEAREILRADIKVAESHLDLLLPWFRTLDEIRHAVLVSMVFQLGADGLMKFTNTLAAVKEGRWDDAAKGMRASLWWRQTTARAERLASAMASGDPESFRLT